MIHLLKKYGNIVMTTTKGHRVRYHLSLLFLVHLTTSGVLSTQSDRGFFHYLHAAFSTQLKSKVGLDIPKAKALRITLYLLLGWGAHHFKNTCSPITLANISSINVVFIFRCSSSTNNPVYVSRVDSSSLVFSLSSHRHSYIDLVFSSCFID